MGTPERAAPRRILVRGVNWVGDAVLTLPAILALARRYPQAEIGVLARPWVAALYAGQVGVDRILVEERAGRHRGLCGRVRLGRELREAAFDLALLLPNSLEAALGPWLAGIPRRVGYARDGRSPLLTERLHPRRIPGRHQVEWYLDLARALGAEGAPPPRLALRPQAREDVRALLASEGIDEATGLLAVNPGSVYGTAKRWPVERFAAAADALGERLGCRVLLIGSSGERPILEAVASRMRRPSVRLGGRTDLAGLAALLTRCRLLLSNDTGSMHVAAAVGTPVLAVFGPTDAVATGPLGPRSRIARRPVPCSPCLLRECPIDHRCMRAVSVAEVTEMALDLLTTARTQPGANAAESPAAFLDRDGTIIEDPGYLKDPEAIRMIPGAVEALAALRRTGYRLILVTNQSGVARGLMTEADVHRVNERLQAILTAAGVPLDAIYYCPHHDEEGGPPYRQACDCRKPGPGMVRRALRDQPVDPARSVIIGDHLSDVGVAAHFPGMRGVLLLTGHGASQRVRLGTPGAARPDHVAADLAAAVAWLVGDEERTRGDAAHPA